MHFSLMVLTNGEHTVEEVLERFYFGSEEFNEKYIECTRKEIINDAKIMKENIKESSLKGKKIDKHQMELLKCETDQEFYDWAYDEFSEYDEEGNLISSCNPEGRIDYCSAGGRYSNLIKARLGISNVHLKNDLFGILGIPSLITSKEGYDCALLEDFILELSEEEKNDNSKYWDELESYGEDDIEFKKIKEKYITKENYVRLNGTFLTYAVITPDGKWYDMNDMNELADSKLRNETNWILNYRKFFIDKFKPNTIATIIDCHA